MCVFGFNFVYICFLVLEYGMILEGSKLEKEGWREREGGVCACWGGGGGEER